MAEEAVEEGGRRGVRRGVGAVALLLMGTFGISLSYGMMLLLPLLAVALAVPPKRSTSGLGLFLSIVMVVTYHKVNQYAEQMGAQGRIDPLIALWLPFILFAALILWMYWTLAYKPGGQPIGALERVFSRISKTIGRILRPWRRRQVQPA